MKKIIVLTLLNFAVYAQNIFTDPRDGKKYKTVKIGNQTWMAQNIDYHGEDGFLGLCYGDEPQKKIRKPENCKKYGRLYDWDEAIKACPKGWHLPSDKEWQTLVDFAGGDDVAGKKLKAKNLWKEYDFSEKSPKSPKCKWTSEDKVTKHDKCTTDEYGFSALPGGDGNSGGGSYNAGIYGNYWSASESEYSSYSAQYWRMSYSSEGAYLGYDGKYGLLSVRCVQD